MADELELTGVEPDEELAFHRAIVRHFHEDTDDDALAPWKGVIPLDRSIVARDGGRIVANLAAFPVDLSVPGGGPLPCAGITTVGVSSTHRRRGLLTRMMARGIEQARAAGEPVAALFASESAIYPRFGYGITAPTSSYHADLTPLRFREPVDVGPVVAATPEEALATFPAIHEAMRQQRPGSVSYTAGAWRIALQEDPPSWRDGATARRLVHVPGRGYATYRVKDDWRDLLPAGELRVLELVALDTDAERALWQHLVSVDLVTTLRAGMRPPDDLLPWLVVDPLRLRRSEGPPLYTCLLDVARCLAARTSTVTDGLVLRVHDAFAGQDGTYRWDVSPEGSACTRVDADPDVELDLSALSSVWLGGVPPLALRDAGRIDERRPGAVTRLARMVWTARAPWTTREF